MLGWIGGRLLVDRAGPLALDLSAHGGRSADATGSRWLSGVGGGTFTRRMGSWLVDGRVEWFGIHHARPDTYRAHALRFAPRAVRAVGPFTVSAVAEVSRGGWRIGGPAEKGAQANAISDLEGGLRLTGGGLALGRGVGSTWLEGSIAVYDAINGTVDGTFAAVGTSGRFAIGPAAISLNATYWRTPIDGELDISAAISTRVSSRLVAYASVETGRTDPLLGTPRSSTASLGMSWRVARSRRTQDLPVVEVAERVGRGRRVRFQIAGGVAERIALAGSFTDWQPRPMRRDRDLWVLDLVLEPGIHHFGFLLDGERWFVPGHAPGLVDDGWGRKNASFVIQEGP